MWDELYNDFPYLRNSSFRIDLYDLNSESVIVKQPIRYKIRLFTKIGLVIKKLYNRITLYITKRRIIRNPKLAYLKEEQVINYAERKFGNFYNMICSLYMHKPVKVTDIAVYENKRFNITFTGTVVSVTYEEYSISIGVKVILSNGESVIQYVDLNKIDSIIN